MIEPGRDVTGELEMLLLILADRNDVRVVEQDVRRHQRRVIENARIGGLPSRERILVGMPALELSRREKATEHPRELEHLGNVRLPVEQRPVRIEAASQPRGGDVADVAAKRRGIPNGGEGVIVGDEVKSAVPIYERKSRPDRSQVVAQMR